MKQTAVEWLRDLYENRPVNMLMSVLTYEEYILEDEWEEALKMEKEQMIDWYATGQADTVNMYEQHLNKNSNTKEK
jgi:hypothetical protein